MNTYIALLRGINVGGHKKTPMAELRLLLEKKGLKNVKTYIQSGNVVFESNQDNIIELETTIADAIKDHFGFEVSVLVKTPKQLNTIFENSPFEEDELKKSYFMMLHTTPSKEMVQTASEKVYDDETYFIINDCIYYFSVKGMGKAKFNMKYFERHLQTFATARNYRTMAKLLEMSTF